MTQPESRSTEVSKQADWLKRLGDSAHGAVIGIGIGVLAGYIGEFRAPASFLIFLVVICGILGAFHRTHMALITLSFTLIGLLGLSLMTPILKGPLRGLELFQAPTKADAIVVLGAGMQCGTGAMGAASMARLVKGLELWKAGYANVLTVSEPAGLAGFEDCPKLDVVQKKLINNLYPDSSPEVLILSKVRHTRDEAARVRDLAKEKGWNKVLLITSPSHSARASQTFEQYGVNVISVPATETRYDRELPLPSDRLAALKTLMYEWGSRLKGMMN